MTQWFDWINWDYILVPVLIFGALGVYALISMAHTPAKGFELEPWED